MGIRLVLCMALVATLASCGYLRDSWINPGNWFGRDREERTTAPTVVTVTDARPIVDQVVRVSVERAPGGAILHAVGLPPTQGYWGSDLVLDRARSTQGRLVYLFRLEPPVGPVRVSTPQSREIDAALFLSDQTLAGILEVQVLGTRNSRAVRR